jgi:hypothetical protein
MMEPGPAGQPGEPGAPGLAGEPGPAGQPGLGGTSCTVSDTVGGARIDCDDGTQVSVNNGDNGAPGLSGEPGLNGTNCSVFATDTGARIDCEDGSSAVVEDGADADSGPSSVIVASDGYQLRPTDVTVFASESGVYSLPAEPVDGQTLRVAFNSGVDITLDPGSQGIRGLGKAEASGAYVIPTSDPGLLTLLYVADQSTWYVNAL